MLKYIISSPWPVGGRTDYDNNHLQLNPRVDILNWDGVIYKLKTPDFKKWTNYPWILKLFSLTTLSFNLQMEKRLADYCRKGTAWC